MAVPIQSRCSICLWFLGEIRIPGCWMGHLSTRQEVSDKILELPCWFLRSQRCKHRLLTLQKARVCSGVPCISMAQIFITAGRETMDDQRQTFLKHSSSGARILCSHSDPTAESIGLSAISPQHISPQRNIQLQKLRGNFSRKDEIHPCAAPEWNLRPLFTELNLNLEE